VKAYAPSASVSSSMEEPQDLLGYSRFDAEDFVILEQIGEIKFGEGAPTTVFVGGGSSIRLYAARLNADRAVYEPGEQASQTLVLREHTKAAADLGLREWAAYRHLGLDSFQPAPTNSDPKYFSAVLGAFVTQTVGAEDPEETSVWTITRLRDLDRDGLSLGFEMFRRNFSLEQKARIFRRVAQGAVQGLLQMHQNGLVHGGIDASSVAIVAGDITSKQEIAQLSSGLSNLGYTGRLGVEAEKDAIPFLTVSRLAGAAGKRGLDKDTVLAGSISRKEDMRRLGVALIEILLVSLNMSVGFLSPNFSGDASSGPQRTVGDFIPLDEGLGAWRSFREQAKAMRNGGSGEQEIREFCEVMGEESDAGWEFLELLVGMESGANPLLQLTRASNHRFIA